MHASVAPELLERTRRGDPHARNQLLEQAAPLVRSLVARMKIPPGSLDDMVQEALLGLMRRLPSYDPNKGAFRAWLAFHTRTLVLDHLRTCGYSAVRLNRRQIAARRKRGLDIAGVCVSLDDDRPGTPMRFRDTLTGDAPCHTECVERRDLVASLIERVPPMERRVLDLLYPRDGAAPVILRRAGAMLNLSESRVSQIRNQGLRRMRALAVG